MTGIFGESLDHQINKKAMRVLGFKSEGKDFYHSDSPFYVEFPGSTLVIGDSFAKPEGKIFSEPF